MKTLVIGVQSNTEEVEKQKGKEIVYQIGKTIHIHQRGFEKFSKDIKQSMAKP